MSGALGDLAIGDIEAFAAGAAGCAPGGRARFFRKRLLAMFRRRGAETSKLVRVATNTPINVLTVWTMTRAEELVGEVRQSDQTVLVEASAFDGTGWPLPIRKGDRLVRWPQQARESAATVLETPAVHTMDGYDLLYRLIVRG